MNNKKNTLFSFKTLLILGIAACFVCIIPFTKNLIVTLMEKLVLHRELRDFDKWNDILVHAMTFFALIGIFWFFFQYTKKGRIIWNGICKDTVSAFKVEKIAVFLGIIAVLYLISYSALIRANYEYADDIRRCYAGHKAWAGWSRYVSETLSVFLHTNFFINDITPLTQLWTIVVLTVSSYLLAYIVTDRKVSKIAATASVIMGLTIYYLRNFSYKYDCPYMALAMLFGIIPFLFVETKVNFSEASEDNENTKKSGIFSSYLEKRSAYIVMSFIGLMLVCTSYQAANSIYIILAIYSAFKMWQEKRSTKEIMEFAVTSIVCFAFTLIFFKLFLMNQFESELNARGTDISLNSKFIETIKRNISFYSSFVLYCCGNTWVKILLASFTVLFPVAAIAARKERAVWSTLAMSLAVLFGMFALSFGAYLVLAESLIEARTVLGFDLMCALIVLHTLNGSKNFPKFKKLAFAMTILLVYGHVVQAVVYGNFIQKQKDYEDFRFAILANDLSKIVDFNKKNKIYIGGITGMPGKSRMERKNYPILGGSVSPVLTKYIIKGYNMDFEFLSELTLDELDYLPEFKKQLTDLPLIEDNFYHSIYGKDNQYYVELKCPMLEE